MSELIGQGQSTYTEPEPQDAPQPLSRPISQEGRIDNTPFTTSRKFADAGIPKEDRADYMGAVRALEAQLGRKLTSREQTEFLRTGKIPDTEIPTIPSAVSQVALRDEFGNLTEQPIVADIMSSPMLQPRMFDPRVPTRGMVAGEQPQSLRDVYRFENVFEEAFTPTTAKPNQDFMFDFAGRQGRPIPVRTMGKRFRPNIV